MAILSKIRERSMFLIIIIGLALFAFVLDPSTLGDFFNSSKVNEIGAIDGESISRQEYVKELEEYKQRVGNRVTEMQASKSVWDNIVRKKIYKNQLSEAGISVGEADVWEEVINAPSVKSNPQFQNEAGLFHEAKFKQFLADTKENNPQMWGAWSNYMNQIRDNAESTTYNNLVTAGLGASLKEGEFQYMVENTKINTQFVYVPYTSVADSLIKINKSEIAAYIKDNEAEFKVEDSRDISYVKFDIAATPEDEKAIQDDVASLIEDFKTAENDAEFLSQNDSDINLDENFKYEKQVSTQVASKLFSGAKGDVFGPYKEGNLIKLSKITAVSKLPDSVKASHILIPFVGSQRATPDIIRTEEQAKKMADSILKVVTRNRSKFGKIAQDISSDKGSAAKEGDLGWFTYNTMTPKFRDFVFEGDKRDIGIVQTPFGFHVIKIDDQKNKQTVLKLATFGKKIVPSEATENVVFQKSEQFALALSKNNNFSEAAKENNYIVKPAVGLKALDENVPGLGNQRPIISWAFGKDIEVGSFKRFDLEGSHVVAFVSAKTPKGLMSVEKATSRVKPILVNQKKAALLADKFNGATLAEIAKANNVSVRTANGVNLKSPTLSGAGSEPKVVGAMYAVELDKIFKNIEGNRGVYAFKVLKRELPTALPNYETNRKNIAQTRKRKTFAMYEAVKKATDVEDNRAFMYSGN